MRRRLPRAFGLIGVVLILGLLCWATGQFAGYAAFGHRRPMTAVVTLGLALLLNMSITIRDQLPYLVIFSLAALLYLIRVNVFDERSSWIRRRIGDPRDVAEAVVRAIEDETTPLRGLLGEDATWYINARSHGDESYRREIWKLWQLDE